MKLEVPISEELLNLFVMKSKGINNKLLCGHLLEMYNFCMLDRNSSSLKEYITASVANYSILPGKLGRDCVDTKDNSIEIKPQTFYGKPCSGNVHFSDYTLNRLEKDSNDNLLIVNSLFCYDKLVYVVEFPISILYNKLKEKLNKICVIEKNRYCRSCGWSYTDWIDYENLKIHFLDKSFLVRSTLNGTRIIPNKFLGKLLCLKTNNK